MPTTIQVIFVVIFGLIIGSFLSALTYRIPRDIKITKGRSFCDRCKKNIAWYDNIPLFSYLVLKGKCRCCGLDISVRYPLVELFTSLGFVGLFILDNACKTTPENSLFCSWSTNLASFSLFFFMIIFAILASIFIVDLEHNIIPDNLVFILYGLVVLALVLAHFENFYLYLFIGFLMADFLLFLHFITKGKGMGLGDVKFALFGGTFLGWPQSLTWLFLAFLTGAIAGIILILLGKRRLKSKIAFGPFLIFSFAVTAIFGQLILREFFLI